ncbi:voltage-gated hydrogen channel 1 [Procambarus clarkii]|uniref:voltage-gated hydrogen channel 1 n=1 Tax=Procambarus clarkii TaxID=6728 RepID=UPI003743E9AA
MVDYQNMDPPINIQSASSSIQDTSSNVQGPNSNVKGPPSNTQDPPSNTQDPPSDTQDPPSSIQDPSSTQELSSTQDPPSETKSPEVWETRSEKSNSSDGSDLRPLTDIRERLRKTLTSTPFQVTVVVLVVVDAILVVGQLLLDLGEHTKDSPVPLVLHALSLALLVLFFLELLLKIFTFRMELLSHKAEVFDGLVVSVALCLDAVYLHSHDAHSGLGLIIILRLWRVVRIQNAMFVQARRVCEKRVQMERQHRLAVEEELQKKECQVAYLQQLLATNHIEYKNEYIE